MTKPECLLDSRLFSEKKTKKKKHKTNKTKSEKQQNVKRATISP